VGGEALEAFDQGGAFELGAAIFTVVDAPIDEGLSLQITLG
jgi:hypothetical protein